MFSELANQAKRLFSTKSNGGRLVYKFTERLHGYKQALLATSIVILLGYSQFRPHFQCQGNGNVDAKVLTNFCWINGTTTIDSKYPEIDRSVSHVGIQFKQVGDGRYQILSHNYMRSLWSLLILMSICSFIAQRWWASIFLNDILRALLKLPENENLSIVQKAQKLRPYDKIIELTNSQQQQKKKKNKKTKTKTSSEASSHTDDKKQHQILALTQAIDSITGDQNEHNHLLDYYPNQFIYLLLASRTVAYKISGLKLRRKLLSYSLISFLMTLMQFLLPLLFIGPEYLNYGLRYAKAWLRYTIRQILDPKLNVNSIDYEISSRIWPTSTSCEYQHYGYHKLERVIVQCIVPINEICAKLFVIIWWFVVLNIMVESYCLITTLISAINFRTIRWSFERKFSTRARQEAKVIATFRYKRAMTLHKLSLKDDDDDGDDGDDKKEPLELIVDSPNQVVAKEPTTNEPTTNEREMKHLEAEKEHVRNSTSRLSLSAKKWYLWCSQDIGIFLTDKGKKIEPGKLMAKNRSPEDELGFKELREDMNIYYLMDLMYLRLNCSRRKMEQIVRMTSEALNNYLESICHEIDSETIPTIVQDDPETVPSTVLVDKGC